MEPWHSIPLRSRTKHTFSGPPSKPVVDILCYRLPPVAPSNQKLPAVHMREWRPCMDPSSCSIDNLQKVYKFFLLKIISFLQCHIAQSNAHIPMSIRPAITGSTPVSHVPNHMSMLAGGVILKAIWMVRQRSLARGQWIKKCCIVSSWSQKQHWVLPTCLHFTKLSLVKITSLCTNHMKIFTFKCTLIFQIWSIFKIQKNNKKFALDHPVYSPPKQKQKRLTLYRSSIYVVHLSKWHYQSLVYF